MFSDDSGAGRTKKTFLDSSETSKAQIAISIGLCPTRQTGSHLQGCHVCTSQSRLFMYRVLAAQVSVCTSIFGDGGRLKNAQRVSHIVGGRYQAARPCKEHAKVSAGWRCSKGAPWFGSMPGALLMPFWMVINTERTVAYNSKLKLRLMEGGPSKINPPVTYLIPFTRKKWNWVNNKKKKLLIIPTSSSPACPAPHDITQVCLFGCINGSICGTNPLKRWPRQESLAQCASPERRWLAPLS